MGLAFILPAVLMAPLAIALVVALGFAMILLGQAVYNITLGEYVINPWKHIPSATHEGNGLATLLLGDFGSIKAAEPGEQHAKWISELGSVFRYRHMFGTPRIFISDPKALLYIHGPARAYKYPKSQATRVFLDAIMGEGLISIEGDKHRRQRRIISPAFTNAAVRELQPVMEKHAAKLAIRMSKLIDGATDRRNGLTYKTKLQDGETPPDLKVALHSYPGKVAVLDMLFWASRTALDVIGDAGFNYQFNSLERGNEDELSEAYNSLLTACMDVDLFQAVTILLSEIKGLNWMRGIPTKRNRLVWRGRAISQRYAYAIVQRAKAEIAGEAAAAAGPSISRANSRQNLHGAVSSSLAKRGNLSRRSSLAPSGDEDSGEEKTTLENDSKPLSPTASSAGSRAPSVLTRMPLIITKIE